MIRLLALSGSLRTGSYNTMLARAAREVAPDDCTLEIATLHGIPLYHGDEEATSGVPPAVEELRARVIASDGLLLVTPEYNAGIPGVFKNAVDWLSRPPSEIPRTFGGRPVALLGASSGRGGTRGAQAAWLPVLWRLGMRIWSGKELYVASAGDVFDARGHLVDPTVRRLLTEFVAGFADFVRAAED